MREVLRSNSKMYLLLMCLHWTKNGILSHAVTIKIFSKRVILVMLCALW